MYVCIFFKIYKLYVKSRVIPGASPIVRPFAYLDMPEGPHPPLSSRSLSLSLSVSLFPVFFLFWLLIFSIFPPSISLPVIYLLFSDRLIIFVFLLIISLSPPLGPHALLIYAAHSAEIHSIGLARPQVSSSLSPFYNFLYDLPVFHVICLIIMLSNGGWEDRELGFLNCYTSFCSFARRLDE